MSQNIVITGANRGIGLSLCKQYRKSGAEVYAVCRKSSPELDALEVNVIDGCDLPKREALVKIDRSLDGVEIDILVNNAGILRNDVFGSFKAQSITDQFKVNALAPIMVTERLKSRLRPRSKVVLITSRMGSIDDNTSGGRYGYRMSKAALNIAGVSLAHDLRKSEVAVGIYHPGLVGTDMIGGHGNLTPDEAARALCARFAELNLVNSGGFWHSNGEPLPW